MYAIILRYKAPVVVVDAHAEAHVAWLNENYAAGHFLLSGQQRPRVGGFILADAIERAALDAVLNADPYVRMNVAEYEVLEFGVRFAGPKLESLIESL
ncbi:YciI family protein [Burkholderia catarinensis]|uniref:YciI family protein n=1 Tax=Burkholderia catarinensis TaxID=1108140 RepID=UPI0010085C96|nr:YciI family protein [Burkholderia catarinensis]KAG8152949.1 GTP cyclohydrolase [Burkholderia catarinensis]